MHDLNTIKARNSDRMRAYRPGKYDRLYAQLDAALAEDARYAAQFNKRPWERADPLPEAEAHPHLGDVDTAKPCG